MHPQSAISLFVRKPARKPFPDAPRISLGLGCSGHITEAGLDCVELAICKQEGTRIPSSTQQYLFAPFFRVLLSKPSSRNKGILILKGFCAAAVTV